MLLSCASVLIVQAVCASSANYPEESKPSPPASQIILCEIFFLDFMSFIPAAKVQLQSLISILIHWLPQIRPRSKLPVHLCRLFMVGSSELGLSNLAHCSSVYSSNWIVLIRTQRVTLRFLPFLAELWRDLCLRRHST